MGSYAIRTRLRSPNTLFHFHVFSEKSFKNTVFWVHFGSNLRHKFDIGHESNIHGDIDMSEVKRSQHLLNFTHKQ